MPRMATSANELEQTTWKSNFTKYLQTANFFGFYEAESAQEALDLCAQDAGYKSEADMIESLGGPSELCAVVL